MDFFSRKTLLGMAMAAGIGLGAIPGVGSPRIASLSMDGPDSTVNEVDGIAAGEPVAKYRIGELDKLSNQLSQYDLLIVTTCANYKANRDFDEFHRQWAKWLTDGGVLLIVDGNYIQTTSRMLSHLWKDGVNFQWSPCQGSAEYYSNGRPTTKYLPLFTIPNKLDKYLERLRGWQHFETLPAGWHSVVECKHGKSMIAERYYGKGRVIVMTYWALSSIIGKDFVRDFAADIECNQHWRLAGLEIVSSKTAFVAGNFKYTIKIRNCSAKRVELKGMLDFRQGDKPIPGFAGVRIAGVIEPGQVREITAVMKWNAPCVAGLALDTPRVTYRENCAPPDTAIRYIVPARIQPRQLKKLQLVLNHSQPGIFSAASLLVDGKSYPATPDSAAATLLQADLSGLEPGRHTLRPVLKAADGSTRELQEQDFMVTPLPMKLSIDERGNLERNGKPFFPISLYHVSRGKGWMPPIAFGRWSLPPRITTI